MIKLIKAWLKRNKVAKEDNRIQEDRANMMAGKAFDEYTPEEIAKTEAGINDMLLACPKRKERFRIRNERIANRRLNG